MKRRPKLLVATLLLLPMIAFSVFGFMRSHGVPSETQMIANFRQNKPAFEKLIQMARKDGVEWTNGVDNASTEVIETYDKQTGNATYKPGPDVSGKRLEQYKQLMQQIDVESFGCSVGRSKCRFGAFGGGFLDASWAVGYAWDVSPNPSTKIVPSAYHDQSKMRDTTVYSKLAKDWYIYRVR